VFSKLLEKLVYNRIIVFIDRNGIVTDAQHGFRANRSTVTALQDFVNDVQTAVDNKMNPIRLFINLSKAYDVLDHKLLLNKLNEYGIRGIANSWVESYLSNRKQYVELKSQKRGKATSIRHTGIGEPQGSILGPILFSLYINDLPQNIPNAKVVLYTDDTNILITGKNTATLHENLNSAINAAQTTTVFFRNYQNKSHVLPQVLFEGSIIPVSIVTKFLGIHISERLKWNDH
jgi:retron-type reverse transcriptase